VQTPAEPASRVMPLAAVAAIAIRRKN